jgi:hypothetical protein
MHVEAKTKAFLTRTGIEKSFEVAESLISCYLIITRFPLNSSQSRVKKGSSIAIVQISKNKSKAERVDEFGSRRLCVVLNHSVLLEEIGRVEKANLARWCHMKGVGLRRTKSGVCVGQPRVEVELCCCRSNDGPKKLSLVSNTFWFAFFPTSL